ncbi:hypothetical protein CSUI_000572 [Cystoisospora suis]|uniref:Uncharacterized protein n=1 Tax=Cystoisospora suis TaxID=483139 RepID=A0A2C6L0F0_9APIC|nr:hypothetical protein CSUI_000572 [Cystoisospora suis]
MCGQVKHGRRPSESWRSWRGLQTWQDSLRNVSFRREGLFSAEHGCERLRTNFFSRESVGSLPVRVVRSRATALRLRSVDALMGGSCHRSFCVYGVQSKQRAVPRWQWLLR